MHQHRGAAGVAAPSHTYQIARSKQRSRIQPVARRLALLCMLTTLTAVVVVRDARRAPVAFASKLPEPISIASAQASSAQFLFEPSILLDGQAGTLYQQAFSVSGGSAPYTFAATPAEPAPGLALSADGILSGIPTSTGSFSLIITATDALGSSAGQAYALNILTPIAISPPALPDGKIDSTYRQRFSASGGTAPYTFTVASGAIPPGLTLSAAGVFSGRPSAGGTYEFNVNATDARGVVGSQDYRLVVAETLSISPAAISDGEVGTAYSQELSASGGTAPYTFTVASGVLPPGLALSQDGVVSGVPERVGGYTFSVAVADARGVSSQQVYTLAIAEANLTDSQLNLPAGSVGMPYSAPLSAGEGTAPYTFALASGLLPPGLSLSSAGQIAGTPSVEGFFSFEVAVTDALGRTLSSFYGVVIAEETLALRPGNLPNGQAGASYRQRLRASGGSPPYQFVVRGILPPGLELRGNGQLTGRPGTPGSFFFGVQVTDGRGRLGGKLYNLRIAQSLIFNPASLGTGQAGTPYMQKISIAGGAAPYTFAVIEGALPPGLSLSAAGTLSGRPTVAGLFGFTIGATDARDAIGSQSYSLRVLSPIAVSPPILPSGRAGEAYQQRLDASGGQAPYTFSLAQGTLPPGLALSADGLLSGTLALAGQYSFTISATDARGIVGSRSYSFVVAPPMTLELRQLANAAEGRMVVYGSSVVYTYALRAQK